MKLMIDTDMGTDDAIALLMTLAHPDADLLALTSVVGNVPLRQATHNIGVVLDIANAPPIPYYIGCARPLLQYLAADAIDVHAEDGLGGAGRETTTRSPEAEHAALALTRLAREHPGEITLLTIGPLTNIALAIRLDPTFLANLKQLVIMAASVDARGNTSPPAEFNVFVDPEAAKIVFGASRQLKQRIRLVSWEASMANAIPFDAWYQLVAGESPVAQFVQHMSRYLEKLMRSLGEHYFPWADPLAAAVTLAPEIITEQESRFLDVEAGHNLARAQTIVDYRWGEYEPPNVDIVRRVDMVGFQHLLRQAIERL